MDATIIGIGSLKRFALDFQWQNIIILPMCKGKMLEPYAWIIPILRLISDLNKGNELLVLSRSLRKIEDESLKTLRINLWEPMLLNDAKVFFKNILMKQYSER